ncbi:TPA: DUF1642 domain-containing protein [Streptococcus suis]|nr:DUF1642 domain-containing protein [Streptococcus suis]
MNKQEAIKRVEELYGYGSIAKTVTDIISQIHEPQKVVVPKFVAEIIEHHKKINGLLKDVYMESETHFEFEKWLLEVDNAHDIVARAWLDGYTVEQDKLYTVEIPDPHSCYNYRFLSKNSRGVFLSADCDRGWEKLPENQLTEAEIKQDFEWAWQFAKEVE